VRVSITQRHNHRNRKRKKRTFASISAQNCWFLNCIKILFLNMTFSGKQQNIQLEKKMKYNYKPKQYCYFSCVPQLCSKSYFPKLSLKMNINSNMSV